ncbi:hypothetical protein PG984_013348 [Apiospora sp. TS-2023a]
MRPSPREETNDETDGGGNGDSESESGISQHQDPFLSPTNSDAPGSTPATSTSESLWDFTIPVPKSKNGNIIYPKVSIELDPWSKKELDSRFKYVKSQLERLVEKLRLGQEHRPVYDFRMVGTCPENARPTIVVTCRKEDLKRLQGQFRGMAEKPLLLSQERDSISASARAFLSGLRKGESANATTPKPKLQLVYYIVDDIPLLVYPTLIEPESSMTGRTDIGGTRRAHNDGSTHHFHQSLKEPLGASFYEYDAGYGATIPENDRLNYHSYPMKEPFEASFYEDGTGYGATIPDNDGLNYHFHPTLRKPLEASCNEDGTVCGATIRFGGACATLGVVFDLGPEHMSRAFMTVNHLFGRPIPESLPSPEKLCRSTNNSDTSSLFYVHNRDDGLNIPWEDNDEYEDDSDKEDTTEIDRMPTTGAITDVKSEQASDTDIAMQFSELPASGAPNFVKPKQAISPSLNTPQKSMLSQSVRNEPWEVIEPHTPLSTQSPYLDWALTRPRSTQAKMHNYSVNIFYPHGYKGEKAISLDTYEISPTNHLASIYMLSRRGIIHGQIITAPSFLPPIFPGQESCEVWTIILENRDSIVAGESGSLVVDRVTNNIYGHVVAYDTLGHGYVVPLAHVLDQINACFPKAVSPVRLAAPRVRKDVTIAPIEKSPGFLGTQSPKGKSNIAFDYAPNEFEENLEGPARSNLIPDPNGGYGNYNYSSDTGYELSQGAPGNNNWYGTTYASDPCLFGVGSNLGKDPSSMLSPIQEFEPSAAANPYVYGGRSGYDLGSRSRDAYRNLLGIPNSHEQEGYEQHSIDSSVYQGSSSNLGIGGRGMQDLDYLTTLSHTSDPVPSSSGGSRARRPRKPPESKKKYECDRSDCDWSFDQPKGLKRHKETTHADLNTAMYTCKCGHRTSIKSNYRRHLNSRGSSCGGRDDVWGSFLCKCGCTDFNGLDEHTNHLDACHAVDEKLGWPRKKH